MPDSSDRVEVTVRGEVIGLRSSVSRDSFDVSAEAFTHFLGGAKIGVFDDLATDTSDEFEWRESARSDASRPHRFQLAVDEENGLVLIRNAIAPGLVAVFSTEEWGQVLRGVLAGEFAV